MFKNPLRDKAMLVAIIIGIAIVLLAATANSASAQSIDEYCQTDPDASFCSGASVKECPDGRYIPEDHQDCFQPASPISENVLELRCLIEGGKWISEAQACISQAPALATNEPPLPTPDEVDRNNCELDGSCDDSCTPPARGDCLSPQPEQLPATGTRTNLLIMAIGFISLGVTSLIISIGLDRQYRNA